MSTAVQFTSLLLGLRLNIKLLNVKYLSIPDSVSNKPTEDHLWLSVKPGARVNICTAKLFLDIISGIEFLTTVIAWGAQKPSGLRSNFVFL